MECQQIVRFAPIEVTWSAEPATRNRSVVHLL